MGGNGGLGQLKNFQVLLSSYFDDTITKSDVFKSLIIGVNWQPLMDYPRLK